MSIRVVRDRSAKMKHDVHVREHSFPTDAAVSNGGEDAGPDPHDIYDSALGACKALTVLWYARRKGIPVEDISVSVERAEGAAMNPQTYKLSTTLQVTGNLSEAQRHELLSVAQKCPIHKLMTQVTTEIETNLAP
jgi:putative redox protein